MVVPNLFSVVVVTYNQEKFVIDTLQSVLNQTYPAIELIVSDDASKDRTLRLVENWIQKHRDRFQRVEILSSPTNQGVPANYNRGVKATRGEFIKCIGGDDILLPDALEKVSRFFTKEPNALVCVSLIEPFGDLGPFRQVRTIPDKKWYFLFKNDARIQFRALSSHCFLPGPSLFFKRDIFNKHGFFDERLRRFEDWPFLLKITSEGTKLHLLPEITVKWRIHSDSISNSALVKSDEAFFRDQLLVYKLYVSPRTGFLSFWEKYHVHIQMTYLEGLIRRGSNLRAHKEARFIKLLDPLWWKDFPLYIHTKLFKVFRLV